MSRKNTIIEVNKQMKKMGVEAWVKLIKEKDRQERTL